MSFRDTYFKWGSWIKSSDSIGSSSLVEGVENSVNNTWVGTECSFLQESTLWDEKMTYHRNVEDGLVVRSDGFTQHLCF